jgi:hypothetical protein
MPAAIVNKLNAEMKRVLANADYSKHIDAIGMVPTISTPQELREWTATELTRWTKVVRDTGIQAQGSGAEGNDHELDLEDTPRVLAHPLARAAPSPITRAGRCSCTRARRRDRRERPAVAFEDALRPQRLAVGLAQRRLPFPSLSTATRTKRSASTAAR